jgi:hypothetical protein
MNKAQTAVAGDERRGRAHGLYLGCLLNLKGLEHPHQVVQWPFIGLERTHVWSTNSISRSSSCDPHDPARAHDSPYPRATRTPTGFSLTAQRTCRTSPSSSTWTRSNPNKLTNWLSLNVCTHACTTNKLTSPTCNAPTLPGLHVLVAHTTDST